MAIQTGDQKSNGELKEKQKEAELNKNNILRNSMHKHLEANDKYINNNNVDTKMIKEKESKTGHMTMRDKMKYWVSLITVEPILAFYIMPSVLSALATQNLYLEKACRVNLQYEAHICDALTRRETQNYTFEESEVQKLVAYVSGWKTVLQSFLPCAIILFLGAYSDRIGQRKFCMLLPIIGEFLTSIGLMINNYYFYELPVEAAAVTEAIFPALTGGWFTMFMGVFSYIADVTTEKDRTVRIGVVNMFYSLGVPIGAALSGILVREIGFYGVFGISSTIYVISFVYGYYRIEEVAKPAPDWVPTKGCCNWLQTFFDFRYVKATILVAFKKGPNNRRLRVAMLLVVLCVVIGPMYGEMAVMYLFTRFRFNWNEVDYSIYSTYAVCTGLVGTLFSVGVFSHLLKFDDALIGVISCTSKILSGFMYAFAIKKWQIYIGPLIEIFSGTSFIAMRSMVSKLVSKDELGKVNSLFGVAEAMMPLVYAPMYTSVYSVTIKTFPGAFFLLGGGLTVPAVLIFMWLYFSNKKDYSEANKKKGFEEYEKQGINGFVNKAFESDSKATKEPGDIENHSFSKEKVPDSETECKDNVISSETEIGITESIHSTSKL